MDINSLEPNSHKYRQEASKQKQAEQPQKKKIEKVISGKATLQKKSLSRRFIETFFTGDAKDVKSYLIFDVLIPAIKETMSSLITKGAEMMLFGEATSRSSKSSSGGTYVSYGGQYRKESRERLTPSRQNRMAHRFDDVKFESRADAEQVIDILTEFIDLYGQATIGDFYDAVGITPEWTDDVDVFGWTDIRDVRVSRVRDGYILELPKCIKL